MPVVYVHMYCIYGVFEDWYKHDVMKPVLVNWVALLLTNRLYTGYDFE